MSLCKVCNKDTEKYVVKVILGDYDPPRRVGIDLRYKTNAEVCPECGVMTLLGANSNFLKMLSEGYPDVTTEQLESIDAESILDEMEVPFIDSTEEKIWVEKDIFYESSIDDLTNGITFDKANYSRLVNFLLLDPQERQTCFGACKCPVIDFGSSVDLKVKFRDGRRRFSILNRLGIKRIPVAAAADCLELMDQFDIPYYTERE